MSRTAPILAPEYQQTLASFALSNVLLAFDYDGTLAPIAARPEDAHMRPSTRRLLASVANVYPTIVISGRALADVTTMLQSVPLWYVYGNHGLEAPGPQRQTASDTRGWIAELEPQLTKLGVRIEDKGHTLTLHFRGVPDREQAVAAIERAVEKLPDVSVLRGNEALNLLPRNGGNKGEALVTARNIFACQQAIYVGDEDTDEVAFAAGGAQTLAIRVEPSDRSVARYHLGSQQEIDALLKALLALRLRAPEGD